MTPPVPAQPVTLGRAEIIAALARAASAHAAGTEPEGTTTIAGRTFAIRLPFGCFGPAAPGNARALEVSGDGLASWTWSEERDSQTLVLTPGDWTRSNLLLEPGAEPPWEHVDGYWIARPWLEGDACPVVPAARPATPVPADANEGDEERAPASPAEADDNGAVPVITASPPRPPALQFTAGLASIREEGASRLGRRTGEPYSFTVRASEDARLTAPSGGYRVLLQGRISTFPDGRAVRCSTESPNRRPVCVAAVVLDSVAFESSDGARLSEWRPEG